MSMGKEMCRFCNNETNENSNFCSFCGRPVHEDYRECSIEVVVEKEGWMNKW